MRRRVLLAVLTLLAAALGLYASVYIAAPAAADSGDAYSSAVMADAPLDWWRLNEATGTYADGGSNNLPLTPQNGTRAQTPCLFALELNCAYVTGASNLSAIVAVQAGGSTPSGLMAAGHSYTVEFAVSVGSGNGSYRALYSNRNETAGTGFLLYENDTQHLELRHDGNTVLTSTAAIALGTPYYLQVTYNAATTTAQLWINGALDKSTTAAPTWGTPTSFVLGNRNDASAQTPGMKVQDVAVYGSALGSARLAAHYSAALNGGASASSTTTTTVTQTTTTPGQTVTVGGTVTLSADDASRLDLAWWGAWAIVGTLFVLMIAPLFFKTFRFWKVS